MTSAVAACNLALQELPHRKITSLLDNSLAAETCRDQLPQVLGELMEQGEWGFALKRATLSEITNDRTSSWGYAYATPNDMAMPLRVLPPETPAGESYLLEGQRLATTGWAYPFEPVLFDFEGSALWTGQREAVLEYVVTNPDYAKMSKRFIRLLALTLASRLAMPIKQDRQLKQDLLSEAELHRQRTFAGDLNRNPTQNTYGQNFIPSVLAGHFEAPE